MNIHFGQNQTDLFPICGTQQVWEPSGVQMHLLKHSHVSNSRSRLPTSPSQDEDRDKQLKQSGAHFNSLPILFARINSPSRPQTNLRAEQIWKSRECTRKKQKGDRRWGHPSHTLLLLQPAKFEWIEQHRVLPAAEPASSKLMLYREHFRADDAERRTHFTLPRQDGIEPLCWHAHIYWTLTLLPNCDNSKAKLSEKQVLLQISAVD